MSASTLAGLASVRREGEGDPVEDARESLVATLAWMTAAAIGRPNPTFTPNDAPAAAESWRTPAGTMTPNRPLLGDAIRSDGRVVAEIETDALGSIQLVVQRTKTGISVVVGLRDTSTATVTEAQRAGLEQALLAAGLSVSSVTFVRLGEDGTAFALHDQGQSEAPIGESTYIAVGEDSRARSSGKRKINTLG
jgi:hypothetical protein